MLPGYRWTEIRIFATILQFHLKKTNPYRLINAALLLAIYLFIATPVSWWHQHAVADETIGVYHPQDHGISNLAQHNDCPVCAHHYSAYSDTSFFDVEIKSETTVLTYFSYYLEPYNAIVPLQPGNKGPPRKAV